MSLLTIADSVYIGVADIRAASAWYMEKLGLRPMPPTPDDEEGCVALGFSKEDRVAIVLGPRGKPTDGATPMLYASKIGKARDLLSSRGVNVGALQKDRQGTHYFEIRDLEGNLLEVSEEP
jgi:hypothetical protein